MCHYLFVARIIFLLNWILSVLILNSNYIILDSYSSILVYLKMMDYDDYEDEDMFAAEAIEVNDPRDNNDQTANDESGLLWINNM